MQKMRTRWLVVGFVSGALAVLLFHQGAAALLHALDLTSRAPYSMAATAPFGIPQLWSIALWGGVWGVLLAAALMRLRGAALIVAAMVFGAVLPTLVAWFVVAPLKGSAGGGWLCAAGNARRAASSTRHGGLAPASASRCSEDRRAA